MKTLKRLLKKKIVLFSFVIITLIVSSAIFAPLLAPYDPNQQFEQGLTLQGSPLAPNSEFLLGTDLLGRDLLSRLMYGARTSLFIGLMINAFGWNPIIALIYAAVLYGITAPVLILIILHICNNKRIMGNYVNGFWINFFGIITFLVMSFASFMLIYLYLI